CLTMLFPGLQDMNYHHLQMATDHDIILNTEEGTFAVQLAGPADDTKLAEGGEGRIELHVQPSAEPRTVKYCCLKWTEEELEEF
ncbi:MAG: hypothetical protein WED82_09525, partial [Balneolales bacterium]